MTKQAVLWGVMFSVSAGPVLGLFARAGGAPIEMAGKWQGCGRNDYGRFTHFPLQIFFHFNIVISFSK